MQRLRTSIATARAVLAWFALSLAVAMAAPVFKPLVTELICGSHGAMVVVQPDAAAGTPQAKVLECPACGWLGAAPPLQPQAQQGAAPLPWVVPPFFSTPPVTAASVAPLPARGPPASSVLLNS